MDHFPGHILGIKTLKTKILGWFPPCPKSSFYGFLRAPIIGRNCGKPARPRPSKKSSLGTTIYDTSVHVVFFPTLNKCHVIYGPKCVKFGLGWTLAKVFELNCETSWWLNQPIWKICSSNWIISPNRGEHKKYVKSPPSELLNYFSIQSALDPPDPPLKSLPVSDPKKPGKEQKSECGIDKHSSKSVYKSNPYNIYNPCMLYLPTSGWFFKGNVGKYWHTWILWSKIGSFWRSWKDQEASTSSPSPLFWFDKTKRIVSPFRAPIFSGAICLQFA